MIKLEPSQLQKFLNYEEQPIKILYHKKKQLRDMVVPLCEDPLGELHHNWCNIGTERENVI